jgi:hypothetical protein
VKDKPLLEVPVAVLEHVPQHQKVLPSLHRLEPPAENEFAQNGGILLKDNVTEPRRQTVLHRLDHEPAILLCVDLFAVLHQLVKVAKSLHGVLVNVPSPDAIGMLKSFGFRVLHLHEVLPVWQKAGVRALIMSGAAVADVTAPHREAHEVDPEGFAPDDVRAEARAGCIIIAHAASDDMPFEEVFAHRSGFAFADEKAEGAGVDRAGDGHEAGGTVDVLGDEDVAVEELRREYRIAHDSLVIGNTVDRADLGEEKPDAEEATLFDHAIANHLLAG